MARVIVRFFATVREAAGVPSASVEARNMGELLDALGDVFGPRLRRLLAESRSDPERIVVLVNGRNLEGGRAREHRLEEGDEIAIFPPVSGG